MATVTLTKEQQTVANHLATHEPQMATAVKDATAAGIPWQEIINALIQGGLQLLLQLIASKKAGPVAAGS